MTRPRSWSGDESWSVVLAVAAIAIPPKPTPTIRSIDSGNKRDTASATSPAPSTMAPAAMRDGLGLRPNASHRAPSSDPTPDAAIRNP